MRTVLCLLLVTAFAAAEKPRLVVVVSVDQLRPDTLARFRDAYTGGLKRVLESGAAFAAVHDHAATETAPGHATLLTGCHPAKHGIVANRWLDRATLLPVYCIGDAAHGASARNLLRDTLGDWMKAADPRTKVVSVSGKDRSAVLMGGRRADAVFWLDRGGDGFATSTAYAPDGAPAWLAKLNEAWLAALPEAWTYEPHPDLRADDDPRESPRYGRASPHPLRADTRKDTLDRVYRSPFVDALTLRLAAELVRRHDLGGDDAPDLLCVSLSATDTVGHLYGPFSQEIRDCLLRVDRELGALFAQLDARGAPWVLALSSDHGVLPLTELTRVNVPRLLARVERRLQKSAGHPALLRQAGGAIYLDRARLAKLGLEERDVARLAAEAFRAEESVHAVFLPGDLAGVEGEIARLVRNTVHPGRSGDLLVVPKHGVLPDLYGTGTTHGSPWPYDREVPLLFAGPGIRAGARDGAARTIDLAPTLARLLGLAPPAGVDGRVLELE